MATGTNTQAADEVSSNPIRYTTPQCSNCRGTYRTRRNGYFQQGINNGKQKKISGKKPAKERM